MTASPLDLTVERRLAEAAAWRARLADLGADSTPDFEAWLGASPANAAAWAQAEFAWDAVGAVSTAPELMAIRKRAIEAGERQGQCNRAGAPWRVVIAGGTAAAAVLAVGGGALWWSIQPTIYQTSLGERRVIPLSDGSKIALDSGTKVEVRYSKDARKLTLVRGQARFDVAHNVQRPFSVRARNETVVATGTAFNIDLMGSQTLVTLIEGHVVVFEQTSRAAPPEPHRVPASAHPIALEAGQELVGDSAAPPKIVRTNLERATAWETGRLIFDDDSLSVVAARISRYSPHVVTVDPAVADLKLSGVFNAGDVDGFVEAITQYLPVEAHAGAAGAVVLVRRNHHS